jgi:hypothetical protein
MTSPTSPGFRLARGPRILARTPQAEVPVAEFPASGNRALDALRPVFARRRKRRAAQLSLIPAARPTHSVGAHPPMRQRAASGSQGTRIPPQRMSAAHRRRYAHRELSACLSLDLFSPDTEPKLLDAFDAAAETAAPAAENLTWGPSGGSSISGSRGTPRPDSSRSRGHPAPGRAGRWPALRGSCRGNPGSER